MHEKQPLLSDVTTFLNRISQDIDDGSPIHTYSSPYSCGVVMMKTMTNLASYTKVYLDVKWN